MKCILQAGFYEIYQPDGRTRVVSYTADDIQGFRANVSYTEPDGYFSSSRYVCNFFLIYVKGPFINDVIHLGGGRIHQKVILLHKPI